MNAAIKVGQASSLPKSRAAGRMAAARAKALAGQAGCLSYFGEIL